MYRLFFFFNDTATTEIYTLSLHDALPIWSWFSLKGTAGIQGVRRGGALLRHSASQHQPADPCTTLPRPPRSGPCRSAGSASSHALQGHGISLQSARQGFLAHPLSSALRLHAA